MIGPMQLMMTDHERENEMSKAPRAGSSKAAVYTVFHAEGLAAAIKKAVALGLKESTAKSWAGGWARSPEQEVTPVKVKRVKLPKASLDQLEDDGTGPASVGYKGQLIRRRMRVVEVGVGKNRAGRIMELGGQVSIVKWETEALPTPQAISNKNLAPYDTFKTERVRI